uniref:Uncharacterized protein n=1 Tax=Meloidogyne incognita TaxID=6306 RepID=A0A914M2D6_MELIC
MLTHVSEVLSSRYIFTLMFFASVDIMKEFLAFSKINFGIKFSFGSNNYTSASLQRFSIRDY